MYSCTSYINVCAFNKPVLKTLDKFSVNDWINLANHTLTCSYLKELNQQEQKFLDFLELYLKSNQAESNPTESIADIYFKVESYFNQSAKPENRFSLNQFIYQLFDWYVNLCQDYVRLSMKSYFDELIEKDKQKQQRIREYKKEQLAAALRRATWQEQADARAKLAREQERKLRKPLSKKEMLMIALNESINFDELDI